MPSNHGRQKKLAKQKKRRESARKALAARPVPSLQDRIVRLAAQLPNGPTFVSPGWDVENSPPELLTIVTTRISPDGMLVPAIALVDRTCLGIKNGFVAEPIAKAALQRFMAPIIEAHGGMEEVELATALSIVHHAIDYARSLGFEPHPDFPAPLFGPRPEILEDTAYGKPERPIFISGPDDDYIQIARRLESALGAGNFSLGLPMEGGMDGDMDGEDDESAEGP